MHLALWVASAQLPAYSLPPEIAAKARALDHRETAIFAIHFLWTSIVYAVLLRFRLGARFAMWANARTERREGAFRERPVVAGWLVAPFMLLLLAVCDLPLALYSHHVSREFGLSASHWPLWWRDWVISTAGTLVIGALVLQVIFAFLRRSPRRWWFWSWLLLQPFIVLGVFAAPLVIDPVFNQFTPLAKTDPALVAQLQNVAAVGGLHIPADRIFLMDASRRATTPNAYVTGIGASKRIVVWDTTVKQVPPEEILAIYAHEQGHYMLGHIWKGMIFAALLTLVLFALLARLLSATIRRFGSRLRIPRQDHWAALPLLLFLAFAVEFVSSPLANTFSRHLEHAADVYGQHLLARVQPHAGQTEVDLFNRLGRSALDVPDPSPWMVWWTYSHPPIGVRAEDARKMGDRP